MFYGGFWTWRAKGESVRVTVQKIGQARPDEAGDLSGARSEDDFSEAQVARGLSTYFWSECREKFSGVDLGPSEQCV